MPKSEVDIKLIRALASVLADTGLTELEFESEVMRIKLGKKPAEVNYHSANNPMSLPSVSQSMVAAPSGNSPSSESFSAKSAPVAISSNNNRAGAVTSPMVGTVFLSPDPTSAAFVKLGDRVTVGQSLLIIEAMKVMNPLPSPFAGTVVEILVHDAQPIEFGEVLLVIEA